MYLPSLLLPLLYISLNVLSLEAAFLKPLRLSARTVACSDLGWELRFSSTGSKTALNQGGRVASCAAGREEGLARLGTGKRDYYKSTIFGMRYQMTVLIMRKAPVTVLNTNVWQWEGDTLYFSITDQINVFISSMQAC